MNSILRQRHCSPSAPRIQTRPLGRQATSGTQTEPLQLAATKRWHVGPDPQRHGARASALNRRRPWRETRAGQAAVARGTWQLPGLGKPPGPTTVHCPRGPRLFRLAVPPRAGPGYKWMEGGVCLRSRNGGRARIRCGRNFCCFPADAQRTTLIPWGRFLLISLVHRFLIFLQETASLFF
jgi:hypothetical protein